MKLIFITGGVLSGIGKGIAAASIGAILTGAGKKVFCQKLDGYLNVDPGTMNPVQHGEVFVTDDGAETDLDIGHYERFLDTSLSKYSSYTTGKFYEEVITRERRGDYLGGTVQVVPHLTDLVKEKIREGYESSGADISIIEIGGTVGDMENEYLIESARQLRHELGEENVQFVHVALLPYLMASKELKSKPIQHSIRTLMSYGITPDFLIVRADTVVPDEIIEKIASGSGMHRDRIVSAPTLDTIYRVPLAFHEAGLGEKILNRLHMEPVEADMKKWKDLVDHIDHSEEVLTIGMIGKYVGLEDAYYSLNEGLKCAGFFYRKKVGLRFIEAEDVEREGTSILEGLDAICIPGGFGERGVEGMILATQYARVNAIPFLGVCLGSQIMAIEYARHVLGIADASSEEFTPKGGNNIIHIMEHQRDLATKGGNMRCGSYQCVVRSGTIAEKLYQKNEISERHRHRYEFNLKYRDAMESAGCIVSATSPDGMLAEIIELPEHPYMIATQAHPEFLSRPHAPHPLFLGLIRAIMQQKNPK